MTLTLIKFSRFAFVALLAAIASLAQKPSTPVILISVDTLRADHLGPHTPQINTLRKNGTIFSQVNTPFPLTLPAHVALLTSTYPFANGVQDNGIPLSSTATTLASVLRKSGYRTSAFVGSYVLDQRFGLNRGFDVYDGPIDAHHKVTSGPLDHKRPGDQVVETAKHWLSENAGAPFFLFLHLYDLHAPYNLPADPTQRHGETGYLAELAFVDQILGDFFVTLQQLGLYDKALIVFTSDHGEGLGDHGESSHGYFIYQTTLHVPLIIHWPVGAGKRVSQDHVDDPSSLLDVAPTILDTIGATGIAEMKGHSLLATAARNDAVYSESVYARNHFACASLRSLRVGNYKYIDAPKPELYDLSADPNEQHNIYDQQRPKAATMRERMMAIRGNSPVPTPKPPSPDAVAALRSLGYLSGTTSASRLESKVDPKDRIADFERYSQALALASAGNPAESNKVLEKLRDKLPEVADIKMSLGLNLRRLGDETQAMNEYKRALELDPKNAVAHFEMGLCLFRLGQPADAIKAFKAALALEPWYSRADEALAQIYVQQKNFPEARGHLMHLLKIDPESYTAHFNLGIFAAQESNWAEAQRQMQAAIHADPRSAEAHNTLGMVYQKQGKIPEATREFEAAENLTR